MKLEIWIPVIVALVSSTASFLSSYFLARSKAKAELKALEQETNSKIETMNENHKHELERLEREFKLKADYDERGAQTELIKEFMKKPEMQKMIMQEFMKQMKR